MATILIPIPNADFDPTETAVPWRILCESGHTLVFATPDGKPGQADPRMVTGKGLGILAPLLMANADARKAYHELEQSNEFQNPIAYRDIDTRSYQALLLPGGHAPRMKAYLGSEIVQANIVEFFEAQKPVGAICHGVLVAARSCIRGGQSVLYGKKTTALLKTMELGAWMATRAWLGSYYRTYPQTVEDEVIAALASPGNFLHGPMSMTRDSLDHLEAGFTVLDGGYLSARWPGDAHRFGTEFAKLLV